MTEHPPESDIQTEIKSCSNVESNLRLKTEPFAMITHKSAKELNMKAIMQRVNGWDLTDQPADLCVHNRIDGPNPLCPIFVTWSETGAPQAAPQPRNLIKYMVLVFHGDRAL